MPAACWAVLSDTAALLPSGGYWFFYRGCLKGLHRVTWAVLWLWLCAKSQTVHKVYVLLECAA